MGRAALVWTGRAIDLRKWLATLPLTLSVQQYALMHRHGR
jgi:hypothetical protein